MTDDVLLKQIVRVIGIMMTELNHKGAVQMVVFQSLYEQVAVVLQMKCEDFAMQRTYVTPEQLWAFCVSHIWQEHQLEQLHMHEVVADLCSLTVEQYWALHSAQSS